MQLADHNDDENYGFVVHASLFYSKLFAYHVFALQSRCKLRVGSENEVARRRAADVGSKEVLRNVIVVQLEIYGRRVTWSVL